jgi:hypothetical protein
MQEYQFHPFANAFPLMSDVEYAELVADIKAHGQREPITKYRHEILDGRNRDKACHELGIKPIYNDFEGTDQEAIAFVISMNIMRRHLSQSQLAMVAADLSGLQPGQHGDRGQALPIGRAAAKLNVGERSVACARKVKENSPELAAKVRAGEVSVSAAVAQFEGTPTGMGPADPDAPDQDESVADVVGDPGVADPDVADPSAEAKTSASFALERSEDRLAKIVPSIDSMAARLMDVENIGEWLIESQGETARQLCYHMQVLVEEFDALGSPTKSKVKIKPKAKPKVRPKPATKTKSKRKK